MPSRVIVAKSTPSEIHKRQYETEKVVLYQFGCFTLLVAILNCNNPEHLSHKFNYIMIFRLKKIKGRNKYDLLGSRIF